MFARGFIMDGSSWRAGHVRRVGLLMSDKSKSRDVNEGNGLQGEGDVDSAVHQGADIAASAPAPSPSSTGGIPGFLSRDQYERVGDDPEPLPQGFKVIEGTGMMPKLDADGNPVTSSEDGRASAPYGAAPVSPDSPEPGVPVASEGSQAYSPSGSTGGFSAIDGGLSSGAVAPAPVMATSAAPGPAQAGSQGGTSSASGSAGANSVESAAPAAPEKQGPNALEAVGAMFSQGADAVRQVNAAKRAHDAARDELKRLRATIEDREAELEHRQDITARFDQIVTDETARQDAAVSAAAAAATKRDALQQEIDAIKIKLEQVKQEDAITEKRLRAAVDAAEAKEASSREGGSRLQRRLDDANRILEKAQQDKQSGVEAAQNAIDSANARLATLREEFADVQRNPSANSAQYSVRAAELQTEISDAMEELRTAQEDLPRITAEVERNIESARNMVAEAKKPIDAARQAFREVTAEADKARDELDTARREAADRQKALRDQAAEREKARREQERAIEEAQAEEDSARDTIAEAREIHDHPEVTQALANALEADRAERDDLEREVEQLAAAERDVRERTRGSRVRFLAVIGAVVAVIVVALLVVLVFMGK